MLVLTRRIGEGIMIGDDIEVKVLDVSGEKVRIGIDAPREVGVYRTEVFERIEAEWTDEPDDTGAEDGAGGSSNGVADVTARPGA
jgi:carbon storage regulator